MKDQETRERIGRLEQLQCSEEEELRKRVKELEEQVNCSLRGLTLEECPKCKHTTLCQPHYGYYGHYGMYLQKRDYCTCLTCGTKWVEEEKQMKRIIGGRKKTARKLKR